MDILKAFKLLDQEYEINIKGTLEDPLFQANQVGKVIGISNIRDTMNDFTSDEKCVGLTDTNKGQRETLFLTELGLYRLLGRSRKPIANTFQKWMIRTVKEIRINGMYKLQDNNDVDKKLIEYNCDIKNHKIFIKAHKNKNVVYLCKLKDFDNKFIIKIGSSQSIKERMSHISNSFNLTHVLLLEVIETDNHTKFERFLHNNQFIRNYFYPIETKDSSMSKETYLVNQEQLNEIIKIINLNKQDFDNITNENIKLKIEETKIIVENLIIQKEEKKTINEKLIIQREDIILKQKELELELKKIELEMLNKSLSNNTIIQSYSDNESTDEEIEETESVEQTDITSCNNSIKKRKNGDRVPKVYQYNPQDLSTPIAVFDSPSDVERQLSFISPAPLRTSAKNNTIYKDFRWLFLNRNEDPPSQIAETIMTKHKSPDIKHIAMIDIKKTKILAVYASQKEAVEARNMKSRSFTRAIQQQSISSGHYWNYFEDCSEEIKAEYLSRETLPEKYISKTSKSVQQIDPKTDEVIQTYHSNREIIKKFQMSVTSLKQASESGEIHKGYKWKIT